MNLIRDENKYDKCCFIAGAKEAVVGACHWQCLRQQTKINQFITRTGSCLTDVRRYQRWKLRVSHRLFLEETERPMYAISSILLFQMQQFYLFVLLPVLTMMIGPLRPLHLSSRLPRQKIDSFAVLQRRRPPIDDLLFPVKIKTK